RRDVVPKEMGGVLTDVVETGRFSAMPLTQTVDEGRTHKMRPAEGGVSIGHYRITAGTLGVLARRGGRPVILSNNHVLANGNERADDRLDGRPCDRERRGRRGRLWRRQDGDVPGTDRERYALEGRRQRFPGRGRPAPGGRPPLRGRPDHDADQSDRRGHAGSRD